MDLIKMLGLIFAGFGMLSEVQGSSLNCTFKSGMCSWLDGDNGYGVPVDMTWRRVFVLGGHNIPTTDQSGDGWFLKMDSLVPDRPQGEVAVLYSPMQNVQYRGVSTCYRLSFWFHMHADLEARLKVKVFRYDYPGDSGSIELEWMAAWNSTYEWDYVEVEFDVKNDFVVFIEGTREEDDDIIALDSTTFSPCKYVPPVQSTTKTTTTTTTTTTEAPDDSTATITLSSILPPIVVIIVVVACLWYLRKSCCPLKPEPDERVPESTILVRGTIDDEEEDARTSARAWTPPPAYDIAISMPVVRRGPDSVEDLTQLEEDEDVFSDPPNDHVTPESHDLQNGGIIVPHEGPTDTESQQDVGNPVIAQQQQQPTVDPEEGRNQEESVGAVGGAVGQDPVTNSQSTNLQGQDKG